MTFSEHSSSPEEKKEFTNSSDIFNSPLASCILPLLDSLGWKGDQLQLHESIPKMRADMALGDFLNSMANMNYESNSSNINPKELPESVLPCLWVHNDGSPYVVIKSCEKGHLIYDGQKREYQETLLPDSEGIILRFSPMGADSDNLLHQQKYWFLALAMRFKPLYILGFTISIVLSSLALMSPLFVMAVYSQLEVAGTQPPLLMISIGICLFIFSDLAFRTLRAKIFTHLSQRIAYVLSTQVLRRILLLPPTMSESSSTQSQMARIKEFENISQFFSGPAIHGLLDLITTVVLLCGMLWIGGSLVMVPFCALLIAITFAALTRSIVSKSSTASSKEEAKRQELLFEMFQHFRSLKTTGVAKSMYETFESLSSNATMQSLETTKIHTQVTTFGHVLNQLAGLTTMIVGVHLAIEGHLPSSSLLACMLLTWKILSPIRNLFTVITQLESTGKSVQQLNRFMNLQQEVQAKAATTLVQKLSGNIVYNGVSMKSSTELQPALMGVSFQAKQGEITFICGHGGVDGANVLEALMRTREYQSGSISINGMNLRQFDPFVLRKSTSFISQSTQLFELSLWDNLKLSHPMASNEEIQQVLEKAKLMPDLAKLPDGIHTMVDGREDQFSSSFLKRFSFARAWLRQTSLMFYLLPDQGLTYSRIIDLIEVLKQERKSKTTIIVSNNPELFKIADQGIWLEQGRVKKMGPAEQVAKEFYH